MTEISPAEIIFQTMTKEFQAALGTEETGQALIEIARQAHAAQQELAALVKAIREEDMEAVNKFLKEQNENVYVDGEDETRMEKRMHDFPRTEGS